MCVKIAHNRGFASRFLKAYFNSVKISIKKIKRNCFSFSPNSLDSSSLKHTGDIYVYRFQVNEAVCLKRVQTRVR